jgi:hypothetical protein
LEIHHFRSAGEGETVRPAAIIEQNDDLKTAQKRRVQVRIQGGHITRGDTPTAGRADGAPVKMAACPLQPEAALKHYGGRAVIDDSDLQILVRQPAPAAFGCKDVRHGGIRYDGHFEHIETLFSHRRTLINTDLSSFSPTKLEKKNNQRTNTH